MRELLDYSLNIYLGAPLPPELADVYRLGANPEFCDKAREWTRRIELEGRGEYVTSALTLYETEVILSSLAGLEIIPPRAPRAGAKKK